MHDTLLLLTESFSSIFHPPATLFQYVVPYFHNTQVKPYLNMFHNFQKERMGTVTSYSEICQVPIFYSENNIGHPTHTLCPTQILLSVRCCNITLKRFHSFFFFLSISSPGTPLHNSGAFVDYKTSRLYVKFPFLQSNRGSHVQLPKFFFSQNCQSEKTQL